MCVVDCHFCSGLPAVVFVRRGEELCFHHPPWQICDGGGRASERGRAKKQSCLNKRSSEQSETSSSSSSSYVLYYTTLLSSLPAHSPISTSYQTASSALRRFPPPPRGGKESHWPMAPQRPNGGEKSFREGKTRHQSFLTPLQRTQHQHRMNPNWYSSGRSHLQSCCSLFKNILTSAMNINRLESLSPFACRSSHSTMRPPRGQPGSTSF